MIHFGFSSPQRDLMGHLHRLLGDDREAICLAYMEAERDGKVGRPRRAEDMASGTHAGGALAGGQAQGLVRMTSTAELRPMCFTLRRIRPLGDRGGKSRCRWTVYSYPDLAFLCDGRIVGDLEKAEGMARIVITAMGGTLEFL